MVAGLQDISLQEVFCIDGLINTVWNPNMPDLLLDGSETHGVALCGLGCQRVLCQNLRFIVTLKASS